MRKKKVELAEEQIYLQNRERDIKDVKDKLKNVGQAPNERKQFLKDESVFVHNGGFISAKILDALEEDIYEVEIIYNRNIPYSDRTEVSTRKRILGWYDIFKTTNRECDIELGEDLRLSFMQQSIDSLISSYTISFGVDFNPPYQRELVWTLEDEQKLIESIFNRVDIGKFVFIHKGYHGDKTYEVLDGKQRISTLYRFYTDQFQYKGFYYSELSRQLKYVFEDTPVSVAVPNSSSMSEKQILNYFLRLNTSGKAMDIKHLEKIQEQYNSL